MHILVGGVVALGWLVSCILCFGDVGHAIVAKLAFSVLSAEVQAEVCKTLPPGMHCDLSKAANWADRVKSKKKFAWSGDLHFVNARDKPPTSCASNFDQFLHTHDNIIWALDKFWQLLKEPLTSETVKQKAMLFLIHLMGDLHNPLHLTGQTRGGNDTFCIFEKHKQNLHVLWDSGMLRKRIRTDFSGSLVNFIGYLQSKPKYLQMKFLSNAAKDEGGETLFCPRTNETKRISRSLNCIHHWAIALNRLNCEGIWQWEKGQDLAGWYYLNNVEVLENLLIVGAMRLAFVLNEIFARPLN